MLNRIIKYSLQNRLLILAASALLLIWGSYTALRMEVDVFPDLTAPTVVVLTEAHGMAPEEAERLVTFPIETAVNGSTGVRRVRSSTAAGISIVWVEFEWGSDVFRARQIVTEKMATVAERLPEGVGAPTLAPQSSIMGEIMLISVTSDSVTPIDLRTVADWSIRPRLLAIGGVSQVVVIGGEYKQFHILASPQRMLHYSVTLPELIEAARGSNRNAAGGFLREYGNEYIVTGVARTSDPAEIGKSVVKTVNDLPVTIADVAEVKIGSAVKIGEGSMNGTPAVIMTVMKQPNTNTLALTEQIERSLSVLSGQLPAGVKVNTQIFRQADFIEASIGNIQKTLYEGMIFVIVVLLVFLANLRATFISLLAIPISLVVAILTLKWLGFTINTMSLGGMAIAIGSLVDDAIIDVENVFRRLKENAQRPQAERRATLEVIYEASVEVRASVINATFIIIAAFVPLFFLSGMEGRLLAPLGIAFIVALFASLIVAVTLTPVLCGLLLTDEKMLQRQHGESWVVRNLNAGYEKALALALRWKPVIIAAAVVLFAVAAFLLTRSGRSFLPEFNEGSLVISAVSLPGISLEESNKIGTQIEKTLLTIPEIKVVTRRTGRAEQDEHAQGVNAAEIDAPFLLDARSRTEFMEEVRQKLAGITTANITIGQPIGHRIDHMLSGTRANIAIKVFGPDLNRMFTLANGIKTAISDIPGLVDIGVEQQIEIPQIQIKAKREMLARYGISVGDFTEFVDVAFAGEKVGEVYEGAQSFDLVVRYDPQNQGAMENMRNTLIDAGNGQKIPLTYVADIVSTSGPNTINRENVQRKVVVSVNVSGRDQKSAVADIQAAIGQSVQLPEGYRIEYGGQFESEAEASRTLLMASLLSLMIVFLLLYTEFGSVPLATVILLNLPLALIGGVMSISLTSGIISIPAIIGFITLFGIATRNGILLVSRYEYLQTVEGLPLNEAVRRGSKDRLSPILLTALTAGLALVPLALGGDLPGNEIQSPMAKVILGGLLTSTLLNLFVIPIVYLLVNRKNARI
ncbi:MAG TPA: efflux RND transporter permease subunit [Saprospiraceae bacterium]|nr:efflux RND transporter permease subunit [Saprospiraceae bacterium]